MKPKLKPFQARPFFVVGLGIVSPFYLAAATGHSSHTAPAITSQPVPWSQPGTKAAATYEGDGLAVIPTADGARLRCVFQQLEAEATREGLRLTSTFIPPSRTANDCFRIVAVAVGRQSQIAGNEETSLTSNGATHPDMAGTPRKPFPPLDKPQALANTGTVSIEDRTIRFARPGLIEEYTVSMDGIRQDFVLLEPPQVPSSGELEVRLSVIGARVEQSAGGATLVLNDSGRKIAYSRLRATDANGRELPAHLEALDHGTQRGRRFNWATTLDAAIPDATEDPTPNRSEGFSSRLALMVDDAEAVYPVRIDPTFSDANWIGMGGIPGANGTVYATVVDASGNLYIGGVFTLVGDTVANYIAKWNGSSWTALGSGMNSSVYALAVSGSNVYAGGAFTMAGGRLVNYIAKWDGSSWTALSYGMNSVVTALAVSGSDVYAGGNFTVAVGTSANYIAKWNGSSWTALGSGVNNVVSALAVSRSNVYAGGAFTMAGGNAVNYVAKWDGSSWSALGSGMDTYVGALAASGSVLYAGGEFTTAGGSAGDYIAKWDGSSWSPLGSGMNGTVSELVLSGGDLYAGGIFTVAGGAAANRIAKWDGSTWTAMGLGTSSKVWKLAVSGSVLYAGGEFTTAGASTAVGISEWDGTNWKALGSGSGMDTIVSALVVSGGILYAGGEFTTAGASAAVGVSEWNGSSWSVLGSGINATVRALTALGSNLYAGGDNFVAKWDGSGWKFLGSGSGMSVRALTSSGSDLYAGGVFSTAVPNLPNNIAKWDGSSWSALGSGVGGGDPYGPAVYALAASGGTLYVGGNFTTAGGTAINYVAQWDGSSWWALGSGMNGTVYALTVSGSNAYAGGYFTTAGGNPANNIAKWNGNSWAALGSGLNFTVSALVLSGSDLYAGGHFTTAGGSPANCIAKWNGSGWSALGSGMGVSGVGYPFVSALAVSGSDLYAGGNFTTAGGKVSAYIARAYLPALPTLSVLHSATDITVSWPSADATGFNLEQAATLASPTNWVTSSASITDNGTNRSVTIPVTNASGFFRLRGP